MEQPKLNRVVEGQAVGKPFAAGTSLHPPSSPTFVNSNGSTT